MEESLRRRHHAAYFVATFCALGAPACSSTTPDAAAGAPIGSDGGSTADGAITSEDGGAVVVTDSGALSTTTSFKLTATTSGTAPFTVGLGFRKGDVPTTFALDLPSAQIDVKRRWNDGSVKHAIVSGRVDLVAGQPKEIKVVAGTYSGGTPLSCGDIQARAPSATVALGSLGTVQLDALLAKPVRTWLGGPEVVECHYQTRVGSGAALRVAFHVRMYRGGRALVRAVVENGSLDVATNDESYAPNVTVDGKVVFDNGGAALTHYAHTRWIAEGWVGGDPGVTPTHDTASLMASRLVPNYMGVPASSAALDALHGSYVPMTSGDWTPSMGETGYQPQIGLLPNWDALFVTSQADPRAYHAVIANAEALGTYPIVWRDSADDLPVKPSARPEWTVDGTSGSGENGWGAGANVWELAHHGSGGYLAYLLTGDYVHLETMQHQAAMTYLVMSVVNGKGTSRQLRGQTRASAWAQRTVGQLVAIAPSDPVTDDYQALLANNAAYWNTERTAPGWNSLGVVYEYNLSAYGTPGVVAPWMHNFFVQTYGHVSDLEPFADMSTWNAVRDYLYAFPVGLLGDGGSTSFCYLQASSYNIKISSTDSMSGLYPTWGEVYSATFGSQSSCSPGVLAGTSGGAPEAGSTGYWGNLMPAIAYAVDHGAKGAPEAWARLTGASNWSKVKESGFDSAAMWGIVPR